MTEQLNSQDVDLEEIKNQLSALQEKYEAILGQLEQLQKLSHILGEIEILKGQLVSLDEKYQEALNILVQNQEQLAALKALIENLQAQLAENLSIISDLTSQLGEQGADIEKILIKIGLLKEECEKLKSSIEQLINQGARIFYEENGTIKCPEAQPGDKGFVNGKEFEAVDRDLLIKRRDEGADLTCVCTSLVTDMSLMFIGAPGNPRNFNQSIGNWDVSNVNSMLGMFTLSTFNQPIGKWDVGKVTNMGSMFMRSAFNQEIGNWNVDNVTNMFQMFLESPFNQPIGDWDVSGVVTMANMFAVTSFNQPIENWNVSNVTNMSAMFAFSHFNQPIGNWNVSNVTNMGLMFDNSHFNQPIGNWNVSNVTNMSGMFQAAQKFNQNISTWCVINITSEPTTFSSSSPLLQTNKPIWGTCPNELLAPNFHNTVWVGDDSYEPCDCGFSGIIGFDDYVIFELGEFGSKEPTGCFPYNFWYRDENSKVENLKIEDYKISFNLKNDDWNWYTEIELVNEKLVITSTSDVFTWIQKYNKSTAKFTNFCK